jgi:hypothetical protein
MQPAELSVKERAVLFALMGEAREISNPELGERWGFRLDGKSRRKLNNLKFVDSRMEGRSYTHELADAGWHWCATQLSAPLPEKATSTEAALYAVLSGVARHLERADQTLTEFFRLPPSDELAEEPITESRDEQAPLANGDIDGLIGSAYRSLTAGPGKFVKISELRAQLPGVPRADLDSALARMYRSQQVNLIPQSNQQTLTDADRQSGLRLGGEVKHLILVRKS